MLCFIEICVDNATSVDPDQTLQNVVSDQGLHSFPVTFLVVFRLKWVKVIEVSSYKAKYLTLSLTGVYGDLAEKS